MFLTFNENISSAMKRTKF